MATLSLPHFKRTIWSYYKKHRRSMPWREKINPYHVVVSEIMLQQTQVHRVIPKFHSFIQKFPTWQSLAKAHTSTVLKEWSGLGYNRRALYLKRIAEQITNNGKVSGALPSTFEELRTLPGIGPNTAGSILAFAFNIPYPFIETNIRSVFIHFFFDKKRSKVHDSDILMLVEKTLDTENPREWYYALMDYGAYLKSITSNPSRKSVHHVKQKPFKGSNRELRSKILRTILAKPSKATALIEYFSPPYTPEHIEKNLISLEREGFVCRHKKNGVYHIA